MGSIRGIFLLAITSLALPAPPPQQGRGPTALEPTALEPKALEPKAPEADSLLTEGVERAVREGFRFLVDHQNRDGSFGVDAQDRDTHIGVTAIAGLAFLAGGCLPGRGPLGIPSRRCLEALLAAQDPGSGLVVTERTYARPMYSHAFATLYLAEAYGMTGSARLGTPLRRAVDLIVASQNPEGGWRYFPGSSDADLSVTACQISALRAARNAGIAVPASTVDRAAAYVLACACAGGSFRYQVRFGHPSFHLTAAALTALQQLGLRRRPEVDAGFRRLGAFFPAGERPVRGHFLYGQFYALQAAYQRDASTFAHWYARVRDRLLATRRADGAFDSPSVGDLYGTALALLILQLPRHSLPLLLR